MKNIYISALLLALTVSACTTKNTEPGPLPTVTATPTVVGSSTPVSSPSPTSTPTPTPTQGPRFVLGPNVGSNVDKVFAQKALDIMNKYVENGCLREKFMKRSVTSLHNIEGLQVKTKAEAFDHYLAGAPYALDLRWYSKWGSRVIGYTYNWFDGLDLDKCYNKEKPVCKTETRIWSNTNIISGYTAGDYAAHLIHEASHQARAGGFVHWTEFDGTIPYEMGYAMDDCVNAPISRLAKNEQRARSAFWTTIQLQIKAEKETMKH